MERKPQRSRRPDSPPGLRARALALLARREYTRRELERRLAVSAEESEELRLALDDFERRGWLSEQRVVEQTLATRRRRFGAERIIDELRAKGVAEDGIAAASDLLKDSELDAAREVWRRKFKQLPADASERARQVRFLRGRGFNLDLALRVTSGKLDPC